MLVFLLLSSHQANAQPSFRNPYSASKIDKPTVRAKIHNSCFGYICKSCQFHTNKLHPLKPFTELKNKFTPASIALNYSNPQSHALRHGKSYPDGVSRSSSKTLLGRLLCMIRHSFLNPQNQPRPPLSAKRKC